MIIKIFKNFKKQKKSEIFNENLKKPFRRKLSEEKNILEFFYVPKILEKNLE